MQQLIRSAFKPAAVGGGLGPFEPMDAASQRWVFGNIRPVAALAVVP
jgi:hypothetical protein